LENGGKVVTRTVWVVKMVADYLEYPGPQTGIRVRSETFDKTTEKAPRAPRTPIGPAYGAAHLPPTLHPSPGSGSTARLAAPSGRDQAPA